MGKIYAPPAEIGEPQYDWSSPGNAWQKVEKDYCERVKQYCMEHGSGPLRGEIVRVNVADGYACYMVLSLKPLALIHLPLGDAYQFHWANRWTASDVKQMVEREKALRKLFSKT